MLERARETWNESERLGDESERLEECGEREEKKERGRGKHMNGFKVREKKKVKKNNYLEVEFLG
jgi:hypothetical protein